MGGRPPAASCTTHNFCDALDEGWIGAGRESSDGTYGTTNDGSAINYDADISGLTTGKPADDNNYFRPCDEGFLLDYTDGGSGTEVWLDWDYGSTITDYTLYFTLYIETVGVGDTFRILCSGATATPNSVGAVDIQLYNNSGTINIKVEGQGATDTGWIEITADTWHTIKIIHDGNAGDEAGSISIDGGGAVTYDTITRDTRYWMIGIPYGCGAADDVDYYIGDIHIENDDA